jgi:hypothetical protein
MVDIRDYSNPLAELFAEEQGLAFSYDADGKPNWGDGKVAFADFDCCALLGSGGVCGNIFMAPKNDSSCQYAGGRTDWLKCRKS